jgi:UDP-N-acetyl-D-glucosamine/UDP-N-acetyl-D-galactosamine dehydrogenase
MATLAVLGLGYVGLGLAVALSQHHRVYGYDINSSRIEQLKHQLDKNYETEMFELKDKNIIFTDELNDIVVASFYIVVVSTPAYHYETPDLSPLISVTQALGRILKKGDVVVFESTVYPGTTEEVCIPILEQVSQLKSGNDFYVGYSPERINPGDLIYHLKNVPKIIAGQTPNALLKIKEIYQSICHTVYPVSSIKAAEAVKVLENTQRDVNIALMNEFTQIMHALELDTHEIIEAAKTKWSFLPFKPGFVGGHCISIDPHYLAFKAKRVGVYPQLILTARHVNDDMTKFVIQSLLKIMVQKKIALHDITIGILGVTYKENVNDIRNSLTLKLIKELRGLEIKYMVHDPMNHVNTDFPWQLKLVDSLNAMKDVSVVILTVGHDEYKKQGFQSIIKKCHHAAIFMDIPNLFAHEINKNYPHLIYWNL